MVINSKTSLLGNFCRHQFRRRHRGRCGEYHLEQANLRINPCEERLIKGKKPLHSPRLSQHRFPFLRSEIAQQDIGMGLSCARQEEELILRDV
jgi:hypothetical protein